MYKIVHISDLHFGREKNEAVEALKESIANIDPDIIVISGDLTQRAKRKDFEKAKNFTDSLLYPKVIIPGNHDIPLYNIYKRLTKPFSRFEYFYPVEEYDFFNDDSVTVFGLNSVRARRWKSGKLKDEELAELEKFDRSENIRIATLHHNLVYTPHIKDMDKFIRTEVLLNKFAEYNIEIILFGHDHRTLIKTQRISNNENSGFIFVQAGSAVSNRLRDENNSFNLLLIDKDSVMIQVHEYTKESFEIANSYSFLKVDNCWNLS